jgi:hypothetical protein
MQFLGLASVAAIVGVAGVSFASTLRRPPSVTATSEGSVSLPDAKPAPKSPAPAPVVLQATAAVDSTPAPVTTPAPPVARPAVRGGFVLVEGRTTLTDSIYAIRSGDSVIVNFDSQGNRTRRSDKIENTLRLTLPMILGRMATSHLDTLKAGTLVRDRDVVGALATGGMNVTLATGATVRVRVLTRDVTGGPIAVGYLATIAR